MRRQRHEGAWPLLCILACLCVLAVTWPRAWERVAPFRSGGKAGRAAPGASRTVASSADERSVARNPAHWLTPCLDVRGSRADGWDATARWSPRLEEAVGRVTELQMAVPAKKVARRPIDVDWPELRLPDPVMPARPPTLSEQAAPSPSEEPATDAEEAEEPATDAEEAEEPATDAEEAPEQQPGGPSLVQRLPPVDVSSPGEGLWPTDIDILPTLDTIVSQSMPHDAESAWDSVWPEPVALLERLDELAWECETGPWARAVARQIRRLGSIRAGGAEDQAVSIFDRLSELNRAADSLAERTDGGLRAVELRRTQYALARRLAIWRHVIAAGGLSAPFGDPAEADTRQLEFCLAQIDEITADRVAGRAWRAYLELDALERFLRQPTTGQGEQRRVLARRTLDQLTRPGMTPEQRRFLARDPFTKLKSQLRRWAAEPADLAGLLRHIEQYEQTGSPSDARRVAEDCLLLGLSADSGKRELGRQLHTYYRNANVRIAITGELLDRMMPDRKPEFEWVNDQVLGKPVHGRSVTCTDVGIRLIPDPNRLRPALEIQGAVAALTESTSGPATFSNVSESAYLALKELEIGTWGLRMRPAQVTVDNSIRLRSLRTSLDMIPLVGAVVQEIAQSQHEKSQPEMTREVEEKIAARAKQQIDEEADARLGDLDEKLKARVLEPLAKLSLGPTMVSAQTTERRLTMRLRLASEEQLAGHTPRPRALSDSLASCQIHESALNNAIERMGFDGGTFTPEEIRRRIAEILNSPEMLEEDPGRDDVEITFAQNDAVTVRCQDGRMEVTLSIAKLTKSPNHWDDFRVRAYYRPEINGRNGELARDGLVELCADQSLQSQIALRTIFSKTFSRHRPWKLSPERLVTDPRMADLAVTQLVIDDGWIGWALGPKRPGPEPVVAQRSPETVD